jgi:hypothetical protein
MVKVGIWFWLLLVLSLGGCRKSYQEIEREELAKGVRYDSIFQGIYLGMTRQDFRDHCLRMNRTGRFVDGAMAKVQSATVIGADTAILLFYPDFVEDKISELPVLAQYKSWAPWNEDLHGDELVENIKKYILDTRGGNFFHPIYGAEEKVAWVKVDGNRRITVYRMPDDYVKIIYKDLLVQSQ